MDRPILLGGPTVKSSAMALGASRYPEIHQSLLIVGGTLHYAERWCCLGHFGGALAHGLSVSFEFGSISSNMRHTWPSLHFNCQVAASRAAA